MAPDGCEAAPGGVLSQARSLRLRALPASFPGLLLARPARVRVNGRTADTFASLEGKTALVTGGSRGIGRAIALELARAGATVTLSYRSGKDEAEAVDGESNARAVQADVSSADEAKRLVEEAGALDILVNNAGVTRDGLLARM